MAQIFVCYSHPERAAECARHLAVFLRAKGLTFFLDADIQVSANWVEVITHELDNCRAVVVLLSVAAISSVMVRHEVKLAHQRKKKLFPVRLEYDGALPYDLGAYLDPIQHV